MPGDPAIIRVLGEEIDGNSLFFSLPKGECCEQRCSTVYGKPRAREKKSLDPGIADGSITHGVALTSRRRGQLHRITTTDRRTAALDPSGQRCTSQGGLDQGRRGDGRAVARGGQGPQPSTPVAVRRSDPNTPGMSWTKIDMEIVARRTSSKFTRRRCGSRRRNGRSEDAAIANSLFPG